MSSSMIQLPPECIGGVIEHLQHNRLYGTLCSLLRTNKAMFNTVAPVVYSEPCCQHEYPSTRLIQTLLKCRPVEALPEILRIAYFPEQLSRQQAPVNDPEVHPAILPEAATSSIDYSSLLTSFHLVASRDTWNDVFPAEVQHKLEMYIEPMVDKVFHQLPPRVRRVTVHRPEHASWTYRAHIRVALTWTLCEPVLEQIRSIDIPLSDISRYRAVAHRFKSLEFINFIIDVTVTYAQELLDRVEQDHPEHFQALQQFRSDIFESMISFVEEVTKQCNGRLCRVECPMIDSPAFGPQECPPAYLSRLAQSLPPLVSPEHVNERNWFHLMHYLDKTCLDNIESVHFPENAHLVADDILTRCRSLKKLDVAQVHPGFFRWAVEEKRRQGEAGRDQSLVPLRSLKMAMKTGIPDSEIDDAAFAFSDTLEELDCDFMCSFQAFGGNYGVLSIGHTWPTMSALKRLSIKVVLCTLQLSPQMFAFCPRLQDLKLIDSKSNDDVHGRTWDDPINLPELRTIDLSGSAAQTFNMNTFDSTPLVSSIRLHRGQARYNGGAEPIALDYDPTVPNSPVHWTWTWNLPHLSNLNLDVGFGSLFQFRMLDRCPLLSSLTLNSGEVNAYPGIVVHPSDFTSQRHESGYISCPKLKNIRLSGAWVLPATVLRTFFTAVAPNAEHVRLYYCKGFEARDCVWATRGMVHLRDFATTIEPPPVDELEDLGIEPEPYKANKYHWHIQMDGKSDSVVYFFKGNPYTPIRFPAF
ncbi:hypothetical protein BGZ94_002539 [Podila epigama]|nr:hypothetical protein BGZ94_002539 [Podila epigama]